MNKNVIDLLIEFDEMGFCPTTLTDNPDEYAKEWKQQLFYAIIKEKQETAREILQIIDGRLDLYRNGVIGGSLYDSGYKSAVAEIKHSVAKKYGIELEGKNYEDN